MSAHPSRPSQNTRRMLGTVMTVIVIALVCIVTSAAFAANPVEEMAKQKIGGGIDPHINSWLSMRHSLDQFLHPEYILRLFLNLALAVACAWVVAWHPRSSRLASLSDLEERKTLSYWAWSVRLSQN